MSRHPGRLRFSAQHGSTEGPLLGHLLLWLVIAAAITGLATGTQLLAVAAISAGAGAGVGSLLWARRWARERHEDAVDEIEGARWWATQQQAQSSSTCVELPPGEPGERELTR